MKLYIRKQDEKNERRMRRGPEGLAKFETEKRRKTGRSGPSTPGSGDISMLDILNGTDEAHLRTAASRSLANSTVFSPKPPWLSTTTS